eukprot:TRINITY_DN7610_c0_g1_i6.p1 TRINITY_DN7610_c0_g1~~TRINITY_DN7610_c0_g1_i6.p1  ORF type:complete len:273 (-),score=89.81 TRINITY_DN7610_c0_g1_i6:86-904(-)
MTHDEKVEDIKDEEVILVIMEYLKRRGHTKVLRELEMSSKLQFNLRYFKENLLKGRWDELYRYLHPFLPWNASKEGDEVYNLLGRRRFLEALQENRDKAAQILNLEFGRADQIETYEELKKMYVNRSIPNDFKREERMELFNSVNQLIKTALPMRSLKTFNVAEDRLKTLLHQAVEFQHLKNCGEEKREKKFEYKTILEDHICPGVSKRKMREEKNNESNNNNNQTTESEHSKKKSKNPTEIVQDSSVDRNILDSFFDDDLPLESLTNKEKG